MAKRKGRGKGKEAPRNKRKPRKRRHIAFRLKIEDDPLYRLFDDDEMQDERTRKAEQAEAEEAEDAFGEMMHNLPSIKTDKSRRI